MWVLWLPFSYGFMLTDESPMPWGKFKGTSLGNVPASYLLYLYDNDKLEYAKGIKAYIQDNYDVLIQESKKEKER